MRRLCLLIASVLFTLGLSAQGYYVFVGSYNWDKNKDGLYVYRLDTVFGKLSLVTSYKILNPTYLTLSQGGEYIYACTEAKTPGAGSVSSFSFDEKQRSLTFINSQKSGGENPVYVTIDKTGKWLINVNYTEAGVSIYPLIGGHIAKKVQLVEFTGSSIDTARQEAAHTHAVVFSPDEGYVFITDLGSDKIRCLKFDGDGNIPLQKPQTLSTSCTPGSGPRHLCFDPKGRYAYCIEELSGTVSAYRYTDGTLERIQRIDAHTAKYKTGFNSADIHISPDGKFLYASNRATENNIAIFSIMQDGKLKLIGQQSTSGDHPRIFDIDPTGKFLVVANQISGDIVVFRRDITTGALKKASKISHILNPSCVKIAKYK